MITTNEILANRFFIDEVNRAKNDLKEYIKDNKFIVLFHPLSHKYFDKALADTKRYLKKQYKLELEKRGTQ
jgi:hypothetical protein